MIYIALLSINNLPYEKVGKNEPVCIADEVPFDIPESWSGFAGEHCRNQFSMATMHQHKKTDE